MFPNSVFNHPVGSFQSPVRPPTHDPNTEPAATVRISCEWLLYIRGALTQLLLESTWDTDAAGVDLVQQRVFNLLSMLSGTAPGDCGNPALEVNAGLDCEDCMGCCLRVQNGVLQTLVCGVWTDVPGQGPGGLGLGQPGAGSKVPAPGGGSQEYCGYVNGNGTWLLPVNVSTGDVIQFADLTGAWNSSETVAWQCPNGFSYFAGACFFAIPLGAPDPLPTVRHMQIIANVNGAERDVLNTDLAGNPQPYTVPGGISNAQVLVHGNTSSTNPGNGQVAFCVTVTNNQLGNFDHVFDFGGSPLGWIGNTEAGVTPTWSPPGWHGAPFVNGGCGGPNDAVVGGIHIPMPSSRHVDTIRVKGNTSTDKGPGNGLRAIVIDGGAPISLGLDASVGDFDVTITINATVNTEIKVELNSVCFAAVPSTLVALVEVRGVGTDPF